MLGAIDWTTALGRLHPLLLHLPVGLIVALIAVESMRRLRRRTEPDAARGVLVALLAITTPLAALTGWLLHESDDYGDPVELHEWLGIALMVTCLLVAVAHRRRSPRYAAWLVLSALLLVPTAHFGASLTHGADYLTEPWRGEPIATARTVESSYDFSAAEPFFAAFCTKCHGTSKQKGGLALHDYDALLAGGDSGTVIVAGNPAISELIARLRLPLDDDDHMPPEGKPQPSADEVDALAAWVASLAGVPDADLARRLAVVDSAAPLDAPETTPYDVEAVHTAVLELREKLVHVAPISADSDALLVDFGAARLAPGELSARLAPLRAVIADLDLSTHALNAHDLEFVAGLPRLERLDLRRLQVEALDLAPLASCTRLRSLNLAGTRLAPNSAATIAGLPALRSVFVWRTGLDEAQLARLAAERPQLAVRGSSAEPDEPLEVEPEVGFTRLPPESTAAANLHATNATCPITGKPVDARYTILFEGRAVGFCCPNCPASFWAEQDAAREDR